MLVLVQMGYGARALELLRDYYNGRFTDVMAPATSVADRRIDRRADTEDQGEVCRRASYNRSLMRLNLNACTARL